MAAQLGSPELLILAWVVAGVITLFGALSAAELAAMMPETGGTYIYYQKIYGDFIAFLYGWAGFAVINTAGVASIAYVCGTYLEYFIHLPRLSPDIEKSLDIHIPFIGHILPLQNIGVKAATIIVVLLLTWISYRSTRSGGRLLVWMTSLKLIAITLVIFGVLVSGLGDANNFFSDSSTISLVGWPLMAAFFAALSGAFWGYDGWVNIASVGGEVKEPQRIIPKSLLIGISTCILIYVLVNLAYLYILPIDSMASSTIVATDAVKVVIGSIGAGIIALMIILSTAGTTHGNILTTVRISFAMSQQGRFFESMGKIHPKFGTPANALAIHGLLTCLFVISGSFDMLTDMLIFVSYLFYGMTAFGVFVLRKRLPFANRPYRVWGYPVVPAVFVLFSLLFLSVTLVSDISNYNAGRTTMINSVLGLILLCIGIPFYWFFKKKQLERSNPSS